MFLAAIIMFSRFISIILRPFAGIIRYGALKAMKRFQRPDDRRPIIATSDHLLNEIILPSVFRAFREDKFRELAKFEKLPVVEHDRIFNELEVAGICLAVFYLRSAKYLARPEDYHFWQRTEEHLPKQLQKILTGYGASGSNAKLIRELIDMRREEYEKIAEKVWEASDNLNPEFRDWTPEMKHFAVRIQAIAVGTTDHIRRGKIKEDDLLIKHLAGWLMTLYIKIKKFVERL